MKNIFCVLAAFICLAACNGGFGGKNAHNHHEPDSVELWGRELLEGKVVPSDNDMTFECVKRLNSSDSAERTFYFRCFQKICETSDGVVGEILGDALCDYWNEYPYEAYSRWKNLQQQDLDLLESNMAFVYYAGTEDCAAAIQNNTNSWLEKESRLKADSAYFNGMKSRILVYCENFSLSDQ
jgi:hypothetical protein